MGSIDRLLISMGLRQNEYASMEKPPRRCEKPGCLISRAAFASVREDIDADQWGFIASGDFVFAVEDEDSCHVSASPL